MSRKRILIMYISMSGNTEEVAELIADTLADEFHIDLYRVGKHSMTREEYLSYDAVVVGSFTWGKGETPTGIKNEIADIGAKHPLTYVFGTGDTQFGGDDLFCVAADKLARFYNSPLKPLKIEQSPRGSQESKVVEWSHLLSRSIKDILN